ncbi:MAG: hypothetical protein ACK2UA_02910, partial [Anaerolineae bacterium]
FALAPIFNKEMKEIVAAGNGISLTEGVWFRDRAQSPLPVPSIRMACMSGHGAGHHLRNAISFYARLSVMEQIYPLPDAMRASHGMSAEQQYPQNTRA